MRLFVALFALSVLFAGFSHVHGQLPDIGIRDNLVVGVVKNVGEKIVLDTKDGPIDVVFLNTTEFKRLEPDNLKLNAAVESSLSEIVAADRVLVTGKISDNRKSFFANKVFLVKGADLEAKAAKQRQEWQQRGISGKVSATDPAAKTITVKTKGITGAETLVVISPKTDAIFKRYSETSARYSDAVPSTFADVSEGDMLQALGDKSGDGLAFTAEEVLTGAFVTVAGTVKSIDAEKNEVTISDSVTKEDVTIAVNDGSMLKRFPAEIAERLSKFQSMMASGAIPAGAAGGAGGRGPGGGGGMGDINQMLNRFPNISVTELEVGEVIAVSSPKSSDPARLTAIKLLAGVGPFLAAMPSSGGGRGRGGISGGINVPGLEGLEF